jgi:hypothetical protein
VFSRGPVLSGRLRTWFDENFVEIERRTEDCLRLLNRFIARQDGNHFSLYDPTEKRAGRRVVRVVREEIERMQRDPQNASAGAIETQNEKEQGCAYPAFEFLHIAILKACGFLD